MNNKKLSGGIIFLILTSCLAFYGVISSKKSKNNAIKSEIIGRVDSIRFSLKKHPIIIVDNKEFILTEFSIPKGPSNPLKAGDSICKKSNSLNMEHYKLRSNGYYLFKTYTIRE